MIGNVWEWCRDSWSEDYHLSPEDASAWEDIDQSGRVLRGGSWLDGPALTRCAVRNWSDADTRTNYLGFRCIREIE